MSKNDLTLNECFTVFTAGNRKFIDPKRFVNNFPWHTPEAVVEFLSGLADAGKVERVYRVVSPDGVIIGEPYNSPSDVPEKVPDRFYSHYYDADDCDIIPGFQTVTPHAN